MTTIDYALMLIAMTFNVGLFFAVIGGFVIGTFLFGHKLEHEPGKKTFADQESSEAQNTQRLAFGGAVGGDCCGGGV